MKVEVERLELSTIEAIVIEFKYFTIPRLNLKGVSLLCLACTAMGYFGRSLLYVFFKPSAIGSIKGDSSVTALRSYHMRPGQSYD